MSKFRFKPEDFTGYYKFSLETADKCEVIIAKIANAHLEAEEAKCVRVYGRQFRDGTGDLAWCLDEQKERVDTHTALLWNASEVEK